ncbi:MAG TPA: ankyrin repeat domain-containing protein [Tepidisphaeraceae bacterium]|jgi:ankyrin repeat protein/Leucine-rich repeat (LRR) protein|nr:ankyrin repeat domain-containing protein [Tepidisphaeraceae bacterium]
MTTSKPTDLAQRSWLLLLLWITITAIAAQVCADPPDNLPADDPKSVKALEKLDVSMNWGEDNNVWKIECRGKQVSDADLQYIKGLRHLEILDLTGTQVTDAGLVQLEGMPVLRNLELDGTAVTDAGMAHVARLPALRFLSLNSTVISDQGLARIGSVKTIEGLYLNGTHVTDAGLAHIQNLPHLSRLELGGEAVESFSLVPVQKDDKPLQLKIVPNVPHPPPGAMAITDAGLARISQMPNLESLVLRRSLVTDKGLAELKRLTKLEDLFLEQTQITDAGLEQLSGMTQLKWLWLSETQITDAGLAHLAGLKNLEMLILDKTKITNAGLVHLQGLPKLKELTLKGTKVNDEGIAKAFPGATWYIAYDHDPKPFDQAAETAIGQALKSAESKNLDTLKRMVKKNPALVNARRTLVAMADRDQGFTPLHYAARNGDLPMVRFLLENHAQVMAGDSTGNTPLHFAANKAVAEALVAAGADVNARGNCGETPLHRARTREVAEVLLAHGANVMDRADDIFAAASVGKGKWNTPLHTQAGEGSLEVVALLIERGADVNALSKGSTPLYWAAVYGRTDIVDLLIAKGARINGFDDLDSPLQAAISNTRPQVIKSLLKAGAILPKPDDQGWTLLHSAIMWGCDGETVEMLLKAGAAVDARTVDQERTGYSSSTPPDQRPPVTGRRTPLHIAAEKGDLEAAVVLIAHGADIHAVTTDGQTPLSLTRREETYHFNAWVQGTEATVKEWNEAERKAIEKRNANRRAIAERIAQKERETGAK